MYTFLSKISQLDSVRDVMLISSHGELLFGKFADPSMDGAKETARLLQVLESLAKPLVAELVFENGRFYVHHTDLGYLIVSMNHAENLMKVKSACTHIQEKLFDSAIRKKVLLAMLADADDSLLPHCVRALIPLADRGVAAALIPMLHKEAQNQTELQFSICETLGHCASHAALQALRDFLVQHQSTKITLTEVVEKAARLAVQRLELDMPPDKAPEVETKDKDQKIEQPTVVEPDHWRHFVETLPERRRIEELLGEEKKSEAVSLVMQAIEIAAEEQQFDKAEGLRDWLIRIDSMSLREIIGAAEIIEEAKRKSIRSDFPVIWKNLAQALSPVEFSSLYHAMTPRNYVNGIMVANQGEFISSLFFVNSGRIQLYTLSQGREIPLKIVGPGEIVGAGTFFDISVWTINAKSLGAELYVLSRETLQSQKEAYPALYTKLMDFCGRFQSTNDLFSLTRRTRRQFERKKMSGNVTLFLQDEQGKDTGIGAKGNLLDISKGGLSLSIRFSRKKNAAVLLAKKIRMNIHTDITKSFSCHGVVKAVRCHDFVGNDYSVHVEFQRELQTGEMQQVFGKGKTGS